MEKGGDLWEVGGKRATLGRMGLLGKEGERNQFNPFKKNFIEKIQQF